MRTTSDRIRHALSFEIIGILLSTPLGVLAFGMPWNHMGVVTIVSATIATVWNFIYNYGFDVVLKKLTGNTFKTLPVRIGHTVLFELGLLAVLLPFMAWYLEISLLHALVMDISFALFYMGYAFVFNLAYDRIFPLPEWKNAARVRLRPLRNSRPRARCG